jgi:hypothetical protein
MQGREEETKGRVRVKVKATKRATRTAPKSKTPLAILKVSLKTLALEGMVTFIEPFKLRLLEDRENAWDSSLH